ncbi:MAG: hypothetical protein Q9P01_20765 [Anaerolineae bacterium]|nr:hypothetical protein [Anaerolineae bacterium]MDQ7037181.1 hypothetical protein [Anaerolineae bacterium]
MIVNIAMTFAGLTFLCLGIYLAYQKRNGLQNPTQANSKNTYFVAGAYAIGGILLLLGSLVFGGDSLAYAIGMFIVAIGSFMFARQQGNEANKIQ